MKKVLLFIIVCLGAITIQANNLRDIKSWNRGCKVIEIAPDYYQVTSKDGESKILKSTDEIIPWGKWDSLDCKNNAGWHNGHYYQYIWKYNPSKRYSEWYCIATYADGNRKAYDASTTLVPKDQWDKVTLFPNRGYKDDLVYCFQGESKTTEDAIFMSEGDSIHQLTDVAIYPNYNVSEKRELDEVSQNIVEQYMVVYDGNESALYNKNTKKIVIEYGPKGEFKLQPVDIRYHTYKETNKGRFSKYYFVRYTTDPTLKNILYTSYGREVMRGYDEYHFYNDRGDWSWDDWYESNKKYNDAWKASCFLNERYFCLKSFKNYIAVRKKEDPPQQWAYCDTLGNKVFPTGKYRQPSDNSTLVARESETATGETVYSLYTSNGDWLIDNVSNYYSYTYNSTLNYLIDPDKHIVELARANLYQQYLEKDLIFRLKQWSEKRNYETDAEYKKRVNDQTKKKKREELKYDFINMRFEKWQKHIGSVFEPTTPGGGQKLTPVIKYDKDREQFTITSGYWGTFTIDVPESESAYFKECFTKEGCSGTINSYVSTSLKDITPYKIELVMPNKKRYFGEFVYSNPTLKKLLNEDEELDWSWWL